MLTFRTDETNFDQGAREGLRIVPGQGLKVDFDEFADDDEALGLWHLHDGAHTGEGTGLVDASEGGHDLTNHGTKPVEDGYRFDRADGDYMDASYPDQPERSALTLEAWVRDWALPADGTWGTIATLWLDASNYFQLRARRASTSLIRAELIVGGSTVGAAVWSGADADAVLAGSEPWHVAAVLEAPNRLSLYVGGTRRAEDTTVSSLPAGDYLLRLGRYGSGWTGYDLSATLDEVRLSALARYSADFTPHRLLPSGTFTGPTHDAGRTAAQWTALSATAETPEGTALAWEVRAADALDGGGEPQASWVPWDGDPVSLPPGRFFQWRATLTATPDRLATPRLTAVEAVASEAGYHLYYGTGPTPEAVDYTEPWARVGPSVTSFQRTDLSPGAVHWLAVRPVDADGRETPTIQDEVRVELDDAGDLVPIRPVAPAALEAEPAAEGRVRLRWRHRTAPGRPAPEVFRVFGDGGSGVIDETTPLAEVPWEAGREWFSAEVGPLAEGLVHRLTARAVAADGLTDAGAPEVSVTPDATAPGTVRHLSGEVVP